MPVLFLGHNLDTNQTQTTYREAMRMQFKGIIVLLKRSPVSCQHPKIRGAVALAESSIQTEGEGGRNCLSSG